MRFEWDENKNLANITKHKVSFELAKLVFEDPHQISVFDRTADGKERYHTLGYALNKELLVVTHTHRHKDQEEITRIISARRAEPRVRRSYHEKAINRRTT